MNVQDPKGVDAPMCDMMFMYNKLKALCNVCNLKLADQRTGLFTLNNCLKSATTSPKVEPWMSSQQWHDKDDCTLVSRHLKDIVY